MWRKGCVAIALTMMLLFLGAHPGFAVELTGVHFIDHQHG